VTYAGLYGGNDGLPVDRVLRREGHPLGVRRAEATRAAIEEPETSASHKRWTLGVAAGALLMAGTFAAGALGLHGGAAPVAGSAPEHAPAAPGHAPEGGGPVAGAPAPGQSDQRQQSRPGEQQAQPTTPASAGTNAQGTPVVPNTGTGGTGANSGGASNQRGSAPSTGTSTPAPGTGTSTPAPEPTTPPASGSGSGSDSGSDDGGLLGTVGDVLSPVTGAVGDILSPSSASTTSTASTKSAPAGPALTMINPLGDLLAVG
jgi:hypothetical protein